MKKTIDTITIEPLLKVRDKFEKFRKNLTDEQAKAGAIQAFEYTYERAWRLMQRIAQVRGFPEPIGYVSDVFRSAARGGLIKDPKKWFTFKDARNLTPILTMNKVLMRLLQYLMIPLMNLQSFYAILELYNVTYG